MGYSNQFYKAVGVVPEKGRSLTEFAKETGVPKARLRYYNDENKLPTGKDLEAILAATDQTELDLALKMGRLNSAILEAIQENSAEVAELISNYKTQVKSGVTKVEKVFETPQGVLYQGDCYSLLKEQESDSVDLIFADPPFNLNKLYPSKIDDKLKTERYIKWCEEWITECIRILKPGGSLFLWNLPKWNATLSNFLDGRLKFKHWIGVDLKFGLPVKGKLYPAHYSLLYYVKGDKANTFKPDRLAMQVCPNCAKELKDYGGYKNKMNPAGINLSDIWTDIPPVRHSKYKRREGANELSIKLLDRIIEMASEEGDLVLDPFGGSGTTYMVAELKRRRWVGCEIGPCEVIVERFDKIDEERKILNKYRGEINALFPENVRKKRERLGIWTSESVRSTSEKEFESKQKSLLD
jgi:site-specific DNA-methyltransferase (adenine-specific)